MNTRVIFLLLTGCFLSLFRISAQDIQEKRPVNLSGVWQMCFYYSSLPEEPGKLRTSNSLKILGNDGRFCNLVMTPTGAVIIGYGSFSLTSGMFYTEYVEKNVHLPQLEGIENKMYFELTDDGRQMNVKYYVECDASGNRIDAWYHEVWRRVELASAYPGDNLR